MARLEDLTPGARVTGVVGGQAVTVVQVQWHGTAALTLTHRDDAGRPGEQLRYRVEQQTLGVAAAGPAWCRIAQGQGLPCRRVRGGLGRLSSRPEPDARSAHCRSAQTHASRREGRDSR